MLERQVTLPAPREDVWAALTDPDRIRDWFGTDVEWDLRPGGAARFSSTDEAGARAGIVDTVTPAQTLRYRWWTTEEDGEPASEVTYTLEDVPDGTRLIVTEQPLAPEASVRSPGRAATVARAPSGITAAHTFVSPWDFWLLGLFVTMAARVSVCA